MTEPYFSEGMSLLYQGDCLEVMASLPDGCVDMVLTDPPYGSTKCKWDTVIPFEPMWEQLTRISKQLAAIVLMASQPFTSAMILSNIEMYKYCWVWNKKKGGSPLTSKIRPIRITEDVVVFGKGKVNYFPKMTDRDRPKSRGKNSRKTETTENAFKEDKVYTQRYPKSILEISNANQRGKVHPTQKPVALMEYLVETYTEEGDMVLDFTMGSGTTGVACKSLNRCFLGIELDEKYCEIAAERIST